MSFSRREFLGVSVGLAAPGLFRAIAHAAPQSNQPGGRDTVLVIVQLTGGNDGLNTVIPFRDSDYQAARPNLKQAASDVKTLNDQLALHPSAGGLAKLFQDNQLAVLQGIGYPQPNRSHFESMDIWHTASQKPEGQYGWLGRALPKLSSSGMALQIGDSPAPLCLKGASGPAPALRSLDEYQLRVSETGDNPEKRKVIESLADAPAETSGLAALLRKSAQETYRSAASLRDVRKNFDNGTSYPQTGLGQRLKLIASLIVAGVSERVYFTSLDGFDTHAEQAPQHARLMEELGGGMQAFQADLKARGNDQRVVTLVYSEFGRRVKENGSQGTDHGAAGPVFLAGPRVKAGVVGDHPSLTDLDDGDLKFHTDFRRIYATLLDRWLEIPSPEILGEKFEPLDVLA